MTAKEKKKYDAETQGLLQKHFESRLSPHSWATSAENLHHAANLLFAVYERSRTENGEPIDFEGAEMDKPASLLYGYAIENAIKGYLLKKLKLRATDFGERQIREDCSLFGRFLRGVWKIPRDCIGLITRNRSRRRSSTPMDRFDKSFAKKWKAHDLADLFTKTEIMNVGENEKLLLNLLAFHVRWAGKYPTALRYDGLGGFVMSNQYGSAKNMPPGALAGSMRDLLDPLFHRLVAAIRETKLRP